MSRELGEARINECATQTRPERLRATIPAVVDEKL
jgi:hypothetical protein